LSGFAVCSAIIERSPDYELDDVLVVQDPKQLRALGDFTRGRIIGLLGQRAASTTELAAALEMPKGTVGHHLKVLEKAGLVRVVRTRQVRALTEKFYGRVARLFELKSVETEADLRGGALSAMMLRYAADEAAASAVDEKGRAGIGRARLTPKDVDRFERRLVRLQADFQAATAPEGELHVLSVAFFRSGVTLPPRSEDA
jgi:DNA-binding transcriptional ArsR family regulator